MLVRGWVSASWAESESGRRVREYKLTPAGRKQLSAEISDFARATQAIYKVIETA
jgi:DNA-binding PadR family transcriptional regulator